MQVLTAAQLAEYYSRSKNLGDEYVHHDRDGAFYTHPEASCIDLEYPDKIERLPFFAHCLATIGYEDKDFEGAVIWFAQWGVWSLFEEGVGYRIIESIHGAAGQPKSFEVAPGHLFRADELPDAIALLMQPMIFGWDGYYLPRWSYGTGEFFVHVSHDSFVSVVTRTKAFYDRVFEHLGKLDFKPRPGHDLQRNRFCRRP